MKYLSIDIEATGLRENDLIIEFAMIPFDTDKCTLADNLAKHFYIQCPSFDSLKSSLDPWVIEHNESLIKKAHTEGVTLPVFKNEIQNYLTSHAVKQYFEDVLKKPKDKIILFGKSMNAIDLPFLNRDLGWEFIRYNFSHRVLDLTCAVMALIDLKKLPPACISGSELMKELGMGEVAHTALEDARNTALMYLKLLELLKSR